MRLQKEIDHQNFDIFDYFDAHAYLHETETDKSDPDVYLLACERLGLSPNECIVFEDGPLGLIAANKAKAGAAIAIYEEGLSSPIINGARADAIYHDFSEWKIILEEFGL